MTIPLWPSSLVYSRGPITQVQPFSYQDDVTFLDILYKLRDYLVDVITPQLNGIAVEVDAAIAAMIEATNEAIAAEGVITDQKMAELTLYVNNKVQEIIDSSVEVQDPVIAGAILNPLSATIAAMYAEFGILQGERGVITDIYVSPTGNDATGDGKTSGTAFRQIRKAVESLSSRLPVIRGTIRINVEGGTYEGGIQFPTTRNQSQDDFIRIVGTSVGGHPNAPIVVIDKDASAFYTYGMQASNGVSLWLQDIKFAGGFDIACDIRRYTTLYLQNVHFDGRNVGQVGLGMLAQSIYDIRGGIIENYKNGANYTGIGIQEHFGITRIFDNVTSRSAATIFRNNGVGLRAKEDCHGHVDWAIFEDNGIGIEFHAWTTANLKAATFNRNGVGVVTVNSEIHNEGGVVWGVGVNANGRRVVALGNSDELLTYGWGENPATIKTGHRPLKVVANDYVDTTITGAITEVQAYQSPSVIPGGQLSVAGRHIRVEAWFSVVTAPVTQSRILLRLGGQIAAQIPIPAAATAGLDFKVVFDVVCPADGNNQKTMATVNGLPPGPNAYGITTINLSDANFSAAIAVIHSEAATSLTMRAVEVYA